MPTPFASSSQAHPMPYHHSCTEPSTFYRAMSQKIVYGTATPLYAHQYGVHYSQLSGQSFFSHMHISSLLPFSWTNSIHRGLIHLDPRFLVFLSHTLSLECSYPHFYSALLFLIGVGFSDCLSLCSLLVFLISTDSITSPRQFFGTIFILLCSSAFHTNMSCSSHTTLLL